MTLVLAVLIGASLGVALRRGDFCFHSMFRNAFARPPRTSLLRAYSALLVVSIPVVQLMRLTGAIDPFVPEFAPAAAIIGGLVFGAGMVIAQTCVSGMFYKLGAGMTGMMVAIAAWAVGDVMTWQGALKGVRNRLNERQVRSADSDGLEQAATATSSIGLLGVVAVVVSVAALAAWTLRDHQNAAAAGSIDGHDRPWSGIKLGAITAAVIIVAWLLAELHGTNYPLGTSRTPTAIWNAAASGSETSWWIPVALVSLIPGALLVSLFDNSLWLRGESATRYVQLAAGGFVMGVGAAIAGGCNLGHSMVGVPLLSLGSIVTTAAIGAGVFVAGLIADRSVRST